MISGIPPFQSKSEYMIFKKIEKLEYSFHEGFDENAKDLVKKLLVIEPKERLGMFFFDISIGYLIVRSLTYNIWEIQPSFTSQKWNMDEIFGLKLHLCL